MWRTTIESNQTADSYQPTFYRRIIEAFSSSVFFVLRRKLSRPTQVPIVVSVGSYLTFTKESASEASHMRGC